MVSLSKLTQVDQLNYAVELYFKANPNLDFAKPKDLMAVCLEIKLFENDNTDGLPVTQILRSLIKRNNLNLVRCVFFVQNTSNRFWYFANPYKYNMRDIEDLAKLVQKAREEGMCPEL